MSQNSKLTLLYHRFYHRFHFALILIISAIVFCHIPYFSFLIGWDDQTFVANHYTEGGLMPRNMMKILGNFYHQQYAPVNQLYYSAIFQIFGYNTVSFHLAGIFVHLITAILVYFFVVKISRQLFSYTEIKITQIAFITTLFFTVAPVNLEPVAWVAASKVLLYAMFYMLSLLWYVKYITDGRSIYYYLAVIGFIFSFGAKEQAVTMPLCMFLIDYIYRRNFKESLIWLEKAPLVVLTLLFALATIQSQGEVVFGAGKFYPLNDRVFLFFYTISEYFTKVIIPVNVSYVYPYPFQIGEKYPLWIWLYPVLIPVILILFKRYFSKKWILFGSLFFLVHILIAGNLFSLARHSAIADRYVYISSIGIYFIFAVILVKSFESFSQRKYALLVSAAYLCYFMAYTNYHSRVWQNAITLKETVRTIIRNRSDYKIRLQHEISK